MAFITLICPHCGGDFELDPARNLQPYWICPYCGNRSLMQKSENSIRLRGIISGKTSLTSYTPQAATTAASSTEPAASLSTRPAAETAASAADLNVSGSGSGANVSGTMPVVIPGINSSNHSSRSLADIIAEAVAEPVPDNETASAAPQASVRVSETKTEPKLDSTADLTPASSSASNGVPARVGGFRPSGFPDVKPGSAVDTTFEKLCQLVETAAKTRDLPLFNSYSRQAIDLKPTDPRMYAWRAILTEEADGFAQATWAAPFWFEQVPSRKQFLIGQHVYNFVTALQYSQPAHRQDLITQIARLMVRQLADYCRERAEQRCAANILFKKFKGRYKKSDLARLPLFVDAIHQINARNFPISLPELLATLRIESRTLPPRLVRRLKKL